MEFQPFVFFWKQMLPNMMSDDSKYQSTPYSKLSRLNENIKEWEYTLVDKTAR
jgi:hypothetical protein